MAETIPTVRSECFYVALHTFRYNTGQVRRILEVAIELAQRHTGYVTLVVKPAGVPAVSGLWVELFHELTFGKGLHTRILEADNASHQIVAAARDFDVVIAPNSFGDILSDGAALLLGSRGLSHSGNFAANGPAVYQTGHGAASDLAGKMSPTRSARSCQ